MMQLAHSSTRVCSHFPSLVTESPVCSVVGFDVDGGGGDFKDDGNGDDYEVDDGRGDLNREFQP